MEIRFDFGDEGGRVLVEVAPNTDPVAVGKSERDLGMPVCTASVEFRPGGVPAWSELHLSPLRLLGSADWNGHRPYLAERYPTWRFGDGDPLAPRIGR